MILSGHTRPDLLKLLEWICIISQMCNDDKAFLSSAHFCKARCRKHKLNKIQWVYDSSIGLMRCGLSTFWLDFHSVSQTEGCHLSVECREFIDQLQCGRSPVTGIDLVWSFLDVYNICNLYYTCKSYSAKWVLMLSSGLYIFIFIWSSSVGGHDNRK